MIAAVCQSKGNEVYRCVIHNLPHEGLFMGKYDIYINSEYYGNYEYKGYIHRTVDETIQYALDSLGIKVDLIDEYSIPIKLVKFSTI